MVIGERMKMWRTTLIIGVVLLLMELVLDV